MRFLTSHLADDEKPTVTLCGLPWEPWQEPGIPTNDEIGFDDLDYWTKVEIRKSDEAYAPKLGDQIRQCQACFKAACRGR